MTLSLVYAPQDAAPLPAVDIVAVHGLDGDAINTWTHPKSKAFWLKDFLPKKIPDARIMTFGYNAAAAFGRSTAEVIDHAKSLLTSLVDKREELEEVRRPLIFIAHSLGGIIVKQALLQARLEPRYQSIKDATAGIIFLGTPHGGSDKATYGKVLANIAQFISRRPHPQLLTALQTNSDVLLRLTSDFRFQLPDYQVYSFFELRPMKGFSTLIVERHSALLETKSEEQIPVDADHSAMCKFETEADDTFEKVYKRLKRMRNSPRGVLDNQSAPKNIHFEVPHLLSPIFTGRRDLLKRLTTSFTAERLPQNQYQQRFVLFGLGGSGKTQTCLKYVHQHRERYWAIFWVDASSENRVQQCFIQIARLLHVDEDVDNVKRALANNSNHWLLIFDNADDPNLKLAPYFPAGDRGDIIITSRNPQHQHYNTVGFEEVTRLSLSDSILLLTKVVYGETDFLPSTSEERKTIVEFLGFHALAIVQAGAYIRETSCSLPEYLEVYQQRKKDLLNNLPPHLGTDYQYSVYATWQASVDMIESKQNPLSHSSLRILSILGFYHYDKVPIQMFYCAWQNLQAEGTRPDNFPWPNAPSEFLDYRQSVQESITLLASFSLVTRNTDLSLSIHPLVHEWCRERLSIEEQQLNCRRALFVLANSVKWKYQIEDYTFRRSLTSHVHELLRLLWLYGSVSEADKIDYWPTLSLILEENGFTKDALQVMEEELTLVKGKYGDDHSNTLMSMTALAKLYSGVGRCSEALQLTEKVLKVYRNMPGETYSKTLRLMRELAMRYKEVGRWSESFKLTEDVLKLQKNYHGEDHPDTLIDMNNLAARYSEVGQQKEAIELMEEVFRLRKTKLQEDHPDTLMAMHNLAIFYSEAGRRSEALQLTEKVLELLKSHLGHHHPNTLSAMHSLAVQQSEAGDVSKALQLMEEVVKLRKSKLGDDHPDALASMHSLAIQYDDVGRHSEGLQLTEEVIRLRKSKLGDDHPDTLTSMNNLAIFYNELGRQSEGLQLMEEVVKLEKSKLGEDHPTTLSSMHSLAVWTHEDGRHSEGLQLMEEVVKLEKSKLGEDHPTTLSSMHNLAVWTYEDGRHSEGLQLTEEVFRLRKAKLGDDHHDTLRSMSNLAICYSELGKPTEGLHLAEEVLKLRRAKLGNDDPDTQASERYLAGLLQNRPENSSTPRPSHRQRRFRLNLLRGILRLGKKGD